MVEDLIEFRLLHSMDVDLATMEAQGCMAGALEVLLDRAVAATAAIGAVAGADRADRAGMACNPPMTSTRRSVAGMTGLEVG